MATLELKEITIRFGGLIAAQQVTVVVEKDLITALIGPNGAGKSTIFNVASGIYRPELGQIIFNEEDITRFPPHIRARRGIGRTFQSVQLFESLTVFENILIGEHIYYRPSLWQQLLRTGYASKAEHKARQKAKYILELLDLTWAANKSVSLLPYGVRKIVEIGRILAFEPKIILLDEPVGGMIAEEIREFVRILRLIIAQHSVDILLIDHNMSFIMDIANYVYVMADGKIIAKGTSGDVKNNQDVIEAYLGIEESI